jgi:hypothetical protein
MELDLAPPLMVWVLDSGTDLDRADRVAKWLERRDVEVAALGSSWCVTVPASVDAVRLQRRTERRLGAQVEDRANCDVAWFPLGRGYAAVLVGPPANGVEDWLDTTGLTYREVRRPSDPERVVRVCVPLMGLPSTVAFADDLRGAGYEVRAMYEVAAIDEPGHFALTGTEGVRPSRARTARRLRGSSWRALRARRPDAPTPG